MQTWAPLTVFSPMITRSINSAPPQIRQSTCAIVWTKLFGGTNLGHILRLEPAASLWGFWLVSRANLCVFMASTQSEGARNKYLSFLKFWSCYCHLPIIDDCGTWQISDSAAICPNSASFVTSLRVNSTRSSSCFGFAQQGFAQRHKSTSETQQAWSRFPWNMPYATTIPRESVYQSKKQDRRKIILTFLWQRIQQKLVSLVKMS